MSFNPHIDPTIIYAISGASIVLLILTVALSRRFSIVKRIGIILLRTAVVVALAYILMNPIHRDKEQAKHKTFKNIVLMDKSSSMNIGNNQTRWQQMMSDVMPLTKQQFETPVSWYFFNNKVQKSDSAKKWNKLYPNGKSTYLIRSIKRVLQDSANNNLKNLIICSDGQTRDKKYINSAIAMARKQKVAISVMGFGQKTPLKNGRIDNVDVPARGKLDEVVNLSASLNFSGLEGEAYQLKLYRGEKLLHQWDTIATNGNQTQKVKLNIGKTKADYTLELTGFSEELSKIDNTCKFSIDVHDPKIRVFYMEGTNSSYPRPQDLGGGSWPAYKYIEYALTETGKFEVESYVVNHQSSSGGEIYNVKNRKKGYPKTKEELNKYDVVICSDINKTIFSETQKQWTNELVEKRGGGFCMIGGQTSFGSGGWDKTCLEKMIPVDTKSSRRGLSYNRIPPIIPKNVLNHPVWNMDKDPAENRRILRTHPPFHGTNMVNRAKPGATVLAYWHQKNNMPLICVQSYGKGRSMAFTPDAAGGWGEGYQDRWGPGRRGNKYYRKFWVNAISWLAENSIRNKQNQFNAKADRVNYMANMPINLNLRTSIDDSLRISATLLEQTSVKLKFRKIDSQNYETSWKIPENYSNNKATFTIYGKTIDGTKEYTDTVAVNIVATNNEFAQPDPDFEVLQQLMQMTGGTNIKSANDLQDLLDTKTKTVIKQGNETIIPLWDTKWLLLLIMGCLTIEWIIRKWG